MVVSFIAWCVAHWGRGSAGLVQHAVTVSKTKKKRAHRAFGQVVCRVLGWDVKKMPFIVLKGETPRFYLANPGAGQGEPKVNAGVKDIVVDEGDVDAVSAEKKAPDEDNSLGDDNANQCKETLHKRISENKEDREEAMDMLCEPEVPANKLDNVLEDNAAAVNDATTKSSEKEAIRDHQCNDRKLMICQVSRLYHCREY
ncbi:uncharacterized protein LOC126786286 isoform X2 [Argentina anserina]|uniref:uncharacterized protein LOC126786286 isoform X2 n=1 Tax=Argentina anserina TaxID=57926 RepID=UPI002176209E|nr:uncharacterized protein LOC126786286 isoform X2 [Potentilla anserina]